MYFTLLFDSEHGPTEIYELVFHPSPIWFKGGQTSFDQPICIPSHRGPAYQTGDFRLLLESCMIKNDREVKVICHKEGHGTQKDLETLVSEIELEGFKPIVVLPPENKL